MSRVHVLARNAWVPLADCGQLQSGIYFCWLLNNGWEWVMVDRRGIWEHTPKYVLNPELGPIPEEAD